jgi:hypothetical protein
MVTSKSAPLEALGRNLREHTTAIVEAPLPSRLLRLLDQLQSLERGAERAGLRNDEGLGAKQQS